MKPLQATPYTFTVAFDEADGEGIVFFGNYFRMAHRALEHFLPQVGIPWENWFKHPEYGVPLRHAEADYKAPMRPGDRISVDVNTAKIGESSIEFTYLLTNSSNQHLASVRTIHVFVSRATMGKTAVPEEIRTILNIGL